jgi:CO/xanthine dehydrogenase FAD-binding subunit
VKKQVKVLENMGITFKVNVNVGKDIPIKDLLDGFDTVFLAGGTWKALKLGVPGEEAEAVTYAIDYLGKINSGEKVDLGQKVIVIGGGSVAIDVARTARRSGSEEVHLVCLECRDLTSKDRMLALDNEILEAEEEGIVIHASLGVQEITVKNGKAVGLNTVTCTSVREPDGAFNPQYDNACTALNLEADSIVIAIGQSVDQSLTAPGLSYGAGGKIPVDEHNAISGMKKAFAGGDIVTGAATVIQAVTSAREAARNIRILLGDKQVSVKGNVVEADFSDSTLLELPRVAFRELPLAERINNIYVEDIPGTNMNQIETEASRCFNCGCLAVEPSDIAVALVALDASIITTKRSVPAHTFFNATATRSNILEADELIKEVVIPRPMAGSIQRYEKFTLRKPIDFAIVSVASVMTIDKGVCKDARIVLGAVAPEPLRAKTAEEFLQGRFVDEKTAADAGKLALEGVVLLNQNAYKVEIAKTLVKRTLLS